MSRREGIPGGSSTGTLLAAAPQTEPMRVVSVVCDTGIRDLGKVDNDQWMLDQGLPARERHGDLRDICRRPSPQTGPRRTTEDGRRKTSIDMQAANAPHKTHVLRRKTSFLGR